MVCDMFKSSLVARRAHNPKVVGSNPTPATNVMSQDIGTSRTLGSGGSYVLKRDWYPMRVRSQLREGGLVTVPAELVSSS